MISRIFENFFFLNKIVKKEKIGLEIISSMKKHFVWRTCEYVLLSLAFLRSVTIVWHESRRYHVSNHLMRHVTRGERVFQIIIRSVRIIISHLCFCVAAHLWFVSASFMTRRRPQTTAVMSVFSMKIFLYYLSFSNCSVFTFEFEICVSMH